MSHSCHFSKSLYSWFLSACMWQSYENCCCCSWTAFWLSLGKKPLNIKWIKIIQLFWWEANFPLITHGPIRLYLLKEPLYATHKHTSLGREVQWNWNSWFVLQLSSASAKYNFFPDNAANRVIIYTTRLFQKHVHRSSLNNHSLKINQAAGTSEWAVQEECLSDGQTGPPRHSRKWWEGDGWTNNRNKNLDEPFGLITPPSPFSPPCTIN